MLHISALALCVLGLGLAGVAAADTPKLQSERGKVKSIDPAHHSLVVTDHLGKVEHKFQWNDHTKFTISGKATAVTELKPGTHVLIAFEAGKGTPMMQTVALNPAKEPKQKPSQPGPTPKT